jgi:hypothetical protein
LEARQSSSYLVDAVMMLRQERKRVEAHLRQWPWES